MIERRWTVRSGQTTAASEEAALSRPFRFEPPQRRPDTVLRPGVQEILVGRFDRRVTLVVAGAGFGKTTALVNAMAENRLRPLGADLWLACEPGDRSAAGFAAGIAGTLGLEDSADGELVPAAIEVLGGRSPQAICLVLDDVQYLGDEAQAMLSDLVAGAPRNVSFVFVGRSLDGVPTARLELIGQAVRVDESMLAFDRDQAARVLGHDLEAPGPVPYAGWPALVEMGRRGDPTRFVGEEVLGLLADGERALLDALVALGQADLDLLAALVPGAHEAALASVPLVHFTAGRWAAHDLWRELLPQPDPSLVRSAIEHLVDRGRASAAVDLIVRLPGTAADGDLAERVVRAAIVDSGVGVSHEIAAWDRTLQGRLPDGPASALLAGLVARLDDPAGDRCRDNLQAAAAAFEVSADAAGEVAALSALVLSHHVRRDVGGLIEAFGRLEELASQGSRRAAPYPILARALVATSSAAPLAVLEATTELHRLELPHEIRAVVWWLEATALMNVGRPATHAAAASYESSLDLPGIRSVYSAARLREGRLDALMAEPTEMGLGERERFLAAVWSCALAALCGDSDRAQRELAVLESSSSDASEWQTIGSVALPRALVALIGGERAEAQRILREMIAGAPPEGQARFYYLTAPGLFHLLLPELRGWFEGQRTTPEFGPLFARDLDLSCALVHVLEDGGDDIVSVELPAEAPEIIAAIGLHGAAVVLAALAGAGREDDAAASVEALIDLLGERVRDALRKVAAGSSVASHDPLPDVAVLGARALLQSMPVPPAQTLVLSMLGAPELRRDGEVIEAADWRRERVRALLGFLIVHPETTREAVMAALWPDAEPVAARRSLRSTLTMVRSLLEPLRGPNEAAFTVRSAGQQLRLVCGSVLSVDVHRFEELLDRAQQLERDGTPSLAVEPYIAASALYRGDLLPETFDEWAGVARDGLRARFVAGATRGAELLLALDRVDEALAAAQRVLRVEPWAEAAHRAVVVAHLQMGDRAAARRAMDTCLGALEEFGGPTDPGLVEVHRRVQAG